MADPKNIRLLLVEDSLEDDEFLHQVVAEIIESPDWPNWHTCELIPVDCLHDALGLLKRQRFDAILLNLSLPDGDTLLDTFTRVKAAACSRPILILADSEDEKLAHTLLREGAQDVLLKSSIDCEILARSLRYAIERQRRLSAVESVTFFDDLTGLYNARGFAALAQHDIQVAHNLGQSLLIAFVEITGMPEDSNRQVQEARELTLIRAAELLRTCFGETAVIGRVSDDRFGICTTDLTEGAVESVSVGFEHDLETINRTRRRAPVLVRIGSSTYSPGRATGLAELLEEAESHLTPKTAMLAH